MENFFSTYGSVIITMLFSGILAISVYLPLMSGQLSLASPGFYAVGGYTAAIMSTTVFPQQSPYPLTYIFIEMLIAAALSAVLAVIVGTLALRLRGIYLALATIAFVEVLRILALTLPITGGAIGIFNIPVPYNNAIDYAWIAVPLLIVSMAFVFRLERIRIGRAFNAIREDELAASAMGINVTYYKVLAFTLGAILAGLVGVVSAHFLNTWNARQGTFDKGVEILAFVLIGGSRTFLGPVVGGMALTALPEVLRFIADIPGLPSVLSDANFGFLRTGRFIIYGLLIALSTIFFPQGLISPQLYNFLFNRGQQGRSDNNNGSGNSTNNNNRSLPPASEVTQ